MNDLTITHIPTGNLILLDLIRIGLIPTGTTPPTDIVTVIDDFSIETGTLILTERRL